MIVGLFPGLLNPGGVQQAGRSTAAVLAVYAKERGMPYRFLSLNDPPGSHEEQVDGMRFRFQGFRRAKGRFVLTALRLAAQRPLLTVAAHPNLAPVAWAMKTLTPGMRFIVMSHGIEVWSPLSGLRGWVLRRADLVTAPSMDTAERLTAVQGVSNHRLRCLPWCLDPDFAALALAPDTNTKSPSAGRPPSVSPEGKVILTVGRLAANERYKGMDMLIEALSIIRTGSPVGLVVVGDGDDRPRLEALAKERGLEGQVHFLGGVPREMLLACYRRCDVFAMPSKGEGFGLVFLEAMALGKPVVGGAHGGTPDIIEDGLTGFLVEHGDVEQLACVLEHLLTDEKLRREMGQRARERVQSRYLFEHFQARLTQIVEELCVIRRPPSVVP